MNKVILVEFFTKWCPFCQKQNKILDELEKEMNGKIEFIRIDIDDNIDLLNGFEIDGIPTLFILKDDDIFKKYIGLIYREKLESAINNALL